MANFTNLANISLRMRIGIWKKGCLLSLNTFHSERKERSTARREDLQGHENILLYAATQSLLPALLIHKNYVAIQRDGMNQEQTTFELLYNNPGQKRLVLPR